MQISLATYLTQLNFCDIWYIFGIQRRSKNSLHLQILYIDLSSQTRSILSYSVLLFVILVFLIYSNTLPRITVPSLSVRIPLVKSFIMVRQIMDLPNELLCKILGYLWIYEKFKVRRVNRRWRDNIDDNCTIGFLLTDESYKQIREMCRLEHGTRRVGRLSIGDYSKQGIPFNLEFVRELSLYGSVCDSSLNSLLLTTPKKLIKLIIFLKRESEVASIENDKVWKTLLACQRHIQYIYLDFDSYGSQISIVYPMLKSSSHSLKFITLIIDSRLNKEIDLKIFAFLPSLRSLHLAGKPSSTSTPKALNCNTVISNTLVDLRIEGLEIDTQDVTKTIESLAKRDFEAVKIYFNDENLSLWRNFEQGLREMGIDKQVKVITNPNMGFESPSRFGIDVRLYLYLSHL